MAKKMMKKNNSRAGDAIRILMVEDNPEDVKVVRRLLEKCPSPITLDVAANGENGFKKFAGGDYDCVLMDYNLPDTNGLDLIKRMTAKKKDVPILMVTGRQDERLVLGALKLGVVDYILKDDLKEGVLIERILAAKGIAGCGGRAKKYERRTTNSEQQIRLLIFEDSKFQAKVYQNALAETDIDFSVDWVTTAHEGFSRLDENEYDCIILDMRLPDSTGFEILDGMRKIGCDTPVVVITGTYRDHDTIRKAFKKGASDFLLKDEVTPDTLKSAIVDTIDTRKMEDEQSVAKRKDVVKAVLSGRAETLFLDTEDRSVASMFREDAMSVYRTLVEAMKEGLISFDLDGVITFTNAQIAEMLGHEDVNEYIGKVVENLVSPVGVRNVREKIIGVRRDAGTSKFELELVHKRGFIIPVLVAQNILKDKKGDVSGVFWVISDLSDQKKAEGVLREKMCALEKANRALKKIDKVKSDFLSMVSHELRTPLASIKEGVALVIDGTAGELNEKQKKFLDVAKRNIDRLAHLINDLLDLSKMESGKIELFKGPIDLNKLSHEAKFSFENLAANQGVSIQLDLEDGLPEVYADRDKISEIFANLLSNAIKFIEGAGKVTVSTSRFEKDPNYILVSVSDTGIGIAKKNLDKLFERFRQLEDTITRKVGGTGLGLAICKQLLELHDGRIWVESEEGKGSSFKFILPIVGGKAMPRKKILVIDDEPDLCTTVKARLETSNLEVETAGSGEEGIKKVKSFKPDMILLDLMMPEMDGFEVCKKLKKGEEPVSMPIVVLTCLEDEDSAKKAISLGASGYLVKPFEQDSLLFTIREFLK